LWCYNTFVKEVNYASLYTSFKFLEEENEMKRKIAILLAAVMTTAMLPMNVMASSSNSVSKRVTVKDDDPIGSDWTNDNETEVATSGSSYKPVYLKLLPQTGVDSGSSILINIENGKFDEDKFPMPVYKSGKGDSYDTMMSEYKQGMSLTQVLNSNLGVTSLELPYKIVNVTKREIEVELFPIEEKDCDKSSNSVAYDKPYYYIPIHAIADGTGDVKITIDDNESNISGGGTYTIATSSDDDGSTTTTIDDLTTFRDADYMETITIKENVKDTFEGGETVTLRLSSGFVFVADSKTKITLTGSTQSISLDYTLEKDDKLTFKLPSESDATFKSMKSATARIKIENLKIEADDEDDDWGDVSLTVSGAGLTKETIQIGTRADYGFKMTTVDSATTIMAGRTWIGNDSDLDDDDFETASVKFEETNAGSWLTSRKLKFTVPEGVKIVDYDFDNVKYVSKSDLYDAAEITTDGTVLSLLNKEMDVDDGECAEFELTLYVSVDADFAGDITVGVTGAGIDDENTLDDVVVANAVTPIKIESSVTKANMGYQAWNTADITVTETEAGALLDGEEVVLSIDSLYGSKELGFAGDEDDIDYTIDGELEIKKFDVDEGEISFEIDKDSYNEPSSITLSNVRVGSTRSVPYGSYDIKVEGDAVVNNYTDDLDDVYPAQGYTQSQSSDKFDSKYDLEDIAYFDTTDGYSFKDYLQITTETGTLDSVVEVTIGESTIKMDGEDVKMDVAPYIQASSNSTMVPLRFVSLAIGVDTDNANSADDSSKVMWDANSKTATVLYAAGNGQKIIQFTAGSNIMVIDGTSIPMENGVVAEITDSRMFVPFRALGQALGVPVTWDADTRTAIYNQK
jgi:hypothetical protein